MYCTAALKAAWQKGKNMVFEFRRLRFEHWFYYLLLLRNSLNLYLIFLWVWSLTCKMERTPTLKAAWGLIKQCRYSTKPNAWNRISINLISHFSLSWFTGKEELTKYIGVGSWKSLLIRLFEDFAISDKESWTMESTLIILRKIQHLGIYQPTSAYQIPTQTNYLHFNFNNFSLC